VQSARLPRGFRCTCGGHPSESGSSYRFAAQWSHSALRNSLCWVFGDVGRPVCEPAAFCPASRPCPPVGSPTTKDEALSGLRSILHHELYAAVAFPPLTTSPIHPSRSGQREHAANRLALTSSSEQSRSASGKSLQGVGLLRPEDGQVPYYVPDFGLLEGAGGRALDGASRPGKTDWTSAASSGSPVTDSSRRSSSGGYRRYAQSTARW
jgi:hypothetical protein